MFVKRFFLIVLLIQGQYLWAQSYSVKHIKSNDTLSLRSHPSVNAQKVGELSYNASNFTIIKCQKTNNNLGPKNWCQVTYNTDYKLPYTGWVAEKYIGKSNDNIRQEIQYENKTFKVIRHSPGETLNVRAGMGSKYSVIGELSYNEADIQTLACQKSHKDHKWCWIHCVGNRGADGFGWVFSKYLQLDEKKTVSAPNHANPTSNSIGTYEVTIAELNVRDNPNKQSNVLGVVKKGMKLEVYEFYGKWGRTKYGWISGKYLKLIKNNFYKSGSDMSVLDYNKDLDLVHMNILGSGEECETYLTRNILFSNPVVWTNCINTSWNVYCTKNKTTCKTYDEMKNLTEPIFYKDQYKAKRSDGIFVYNIDKDFNEAMFNIKGDDKECGVVLYNSRLGMQTNCLDLTNIINEKMLCTKDKRVCKTHTEIKNALVSMYRSEHNITNEAQKNIENIHRALNHYDYVCTGNTEILNQEFENIQTSTSINKISKLKTLLTQIEHWIEDCSGTDIYDDVNLDGRTLRGANNLKKSIKEYIEDPNKIIMMEDPTETATDQAEILSYNRKEKILHYRSYLFGEHSERLDDNICKEIINNKARKVLKECLSNNRRVEAKVLSCKNKLIRVAMNPELGGNFDIDCKHKMQYNAFRLDKECKKNISDSCYKFADYIEIENLYSKDALNHAIKALIIKKQKISSNDHMDLAKNHNQIGMIYTNKGDYPRALIQLEKALKIRKKFLDSDRADIAESYYGLGVFHTKSGDYPKALKYLKKALKIQMKTLGIEHESTAENYNAMGIIYTQIGDYPKALKLSNKALDIREKVLGVENLEITQSYNTIGEIYYLMDNNTKALEYFFKALKIRMLLLYRNHIDTLILYNNIAFTYKSMNNYEKAEEYFKKVLLKNSKKDLVTSQAYSGIGTLYMLSKEYPDALSYFKRALATQENILGPTHPDTATTYYNIGAAYNKMKKYAKAYEFSKKSFDAFLENRDKNFQVQNNKQKELYLKKK